MKGGQRQQHNKPSTQKKMKRGEKKRGKFNTQPEGPRGVSNCVIKYVTGSLDVSVEAWSRCYYCADVCDVHTYTYKSMNMHVNLHNLWYVG